MADSDSTKTATAAPTRHFLPCFSNAEALQLLWYRASENLQPHELEWFASNAAGTVGMDAKNLADSLLGLSILISDDGNGGHFATADNACSLVHTIAAQVSTLAGMADIAADASSRLRMNGGAV